MFMNLHKWLILFLFVAFSKVEAQVISATKQANSILLNNASIYIDPNDHKVAVIAASLLQKDIEVVTGKRLPLVHSIPTKGTLIAIGTLERSSGIHQLAGQKKITTSPIAGKWEAFTIQSLKTNSKGNTGLNGLVIAGSDRRGTAFGVFEISKQIGVSPWYWWADVPVKKISALYINPTTSITDSPRVKYRGIFINDEAPALSNWSREKFGGFNHKFYEKVFELMLRLKSNYIWPAMWGNAFYYDDSLNIKMADDYGIVIGTSHHEPLMRAHEEWKYFGKGRKWNYDSTEAGLQEYWRGGMQRAWNEKIVSVGMRGDGDEPMTRETATALLERIVKDQRKLIAEVSGKPAEETPQLWALYKEVQDYYDKGMRVPDDVTLLLCDDNWGNIRKLPKLEEKPRKGGYGIYYHFDYVGGPRNYKWLNTNPLPRIWEQMHMAWKYNARQIWIVNVGDIKPMEFPISFWCDYAWNPEKIGAGDLQKYTEQWAAAQFGSNNARQIAEVIAKYGKYNSRRKPELLDANTYSLVNYNEYETVVNEYKVLLQKAENLNTQLPLPYRDAYFQLVLHPVKAMANLYEMYYYVAFNNHAYLHKKQQDVGKYAAKAKDLYLKDSLISIEYHKLNKGKWNHMMSQTHIGYTYWQQPPSNKLLNIKYGISDSVLPGDSRKSIRFEDSEPKLFNYSLPKTTKAPAFFEKSEYISMNSSSYSRAVNTNGITWKILPDHGRTASAVAPFPVTATEQRPGSTAPHLEYDFYTYSKDSFSIHCYFSPSLNYHNTEQGLQYAISIDNEVPQIISINAEDRNTGRGIWNKWVAENIIIKISRHHISSPGKHTLKYWMVNPGVVLQKLVVDFGGLKPSYLGPPETRLE
jgi:hypothetical protein